MCRPSLDRYYQAAELIHPQQYIHSLSVQLRLHQAVKHAYQPTSVILVPSLANNVLIVETYLAADSTALFFTSLGMIILKSF